LAPSWLLRRRFLVGGSTGNLDFFDGKCYTLRTFMTLITNKR
jgi:hypothetical protein